MMILIVMMALADKDHFNLDEEEVMTTMRIMNREYDNDDDDDVGPSWLG